MTNGTQPDNTEWVVVKHQRSVIGSGDDVLGVYANAADANVALNELLQKPEWFCKYSVEHREKS